MEKYYKSLHTKAADKGEGTADIIVAAFNNVDSGGDRIMPGAFAKSIATKLPKGVMAHNWEKPIAKTLIAEELLPGDPRLPESVKSLGGLFVSVEFNLETQDGAEAYSNVRKGIIDEFSIGFSIPSGGSRYVKGVREITEIELYEWSPVLVGMNRMTGLVGVKGALLGDMSSEIAMNATETIMSRLYWELASRIYNYVEQGTGDLPELLAEFSAEVRQYVDSILAVDNPAQKAALLAQFKAGRSVSAANLETLTAVAAGLTEHANTLTEFVSKHTPETSITDASKGNTGDVAQGADEGAARAQKARLIAKVAAIHHTTTTTL